MYRYRLLDPLDWDNDCREHLWLQTALWNSLVTVEHTYREGRRRILAGEAVAAGISARIDKLQAEQRDLRAQRRALRQSARQKVRTESIDERLWQLSREIQPLAALGKAASICARRHESVREELKTLDAQRFEAVKQACQGSGLWWCNANAVWRSYQSARSRAMREHTHLRYHGFYGEGRFRVQIIHGASVAKVLAGECSQLSIDLQEQSVPWRPNKPPRAPRVSVRGRPIGVLRARIARKQPARFTLTIYTRGREGQKQRRRLTFPLIYDRPLPAEARIQEAVVTRRRVGTRFRHHVVFLLRMPEKPLPVSSSTHSCGINLGFRVRADGNLRVAVLADENGTREYVLPVKWMRLMDELGTLQQSRDHYFDDTVAGLRAEWPRRPPDTPSELAERVGKLLCTPKFGAGKLAMTLFGWDEHYWPEMRERLESWRRQDKGWFEIQANQRERLCANRRETYRLLAREIVASYRRVKLGEIRLGELAQLEQADGSTTELHQRARRNRHRAALYQLRLELCHQANKVGATVISVSGGFTLQCHACRERCAVTDDLMHCCEHCGVLWDQDVNAACNILSAEPREREDDSSRTGERSLLENQVDTST